VSEPAISHHCRRASCRPFPFPKQQLSGRTDCDLNLAFRQVRRPWLSLLPVRGTPTQVIEFGFLEDGPMHLNVAGAQKNEPMEVLPKQKTEIPNVVSGS